MIKIRKKKNNRSATIHKRKRSVEYLQRFATEKSVLYATENEKIK